MGPEEENLPEGVRDILASVPREMRVRVLADYESHYAPFLMMLAGWKAAIQTHYALGEASAIARLQEQFFPLGNWRFPAQGLAVPSRRVERVTRIADTAQFHDPTSRPYTPCGEGWIQPTTLRQSVLRQDANRWFVTLDLDAGALTPDDILTVGQLAFVGAGEEVVNALAAGQWWAQSARGGSRTVACARYEGYMAFEGEMRAARLRQRQLELWLPPFYPYGRKMLLWQTARDGAGKNAEPPAEASLARVESGLRLVGVLENVSAAAQTELRQMAARRDGAAWLRLNAVPVIQAAVEDQSFHAPFPHVGQEFGERLRGAPALFAAVALHDNVSVPVSMIRIPSADPLAQEPDTLVQFAQSEARVARIKLYHGVSGQMERDGSDMPSGLGRGDLQFTMPYPMLGGATVGGPKDRAEWARSAWYHSVLRPPLLTEGDLIELIHQKQAVIGPIVTFRRARRAIVHDAEQRAAHWQSYLWPSVVAQETSFGIEAGGIPSDAVPLLQSLRVAFAPGPDARYLPEFLTGDAVNYLASTLSQYFVLSCFRVEGRLETEPTQ